MHLFLHLYIIHKMTIYLVHIKKNTHYVPNTRQMDILLFGRETK